MPFGVYKRAGSPYWWIWYGTGKERKMESSKKRHDNPLGWKQAFDLGRLKSGGQYQGGTDDKAAYFDAWVEDWLRTLFPETKQTRSLNITLMHWRFIRAYLGGRNIHAPSGVSYAIAMDYFAWRQKNRRHMNRPKVQTAVIEMKLLRRVMAEAKRRHFIPENPLADLTLRKPAHKEKPEITREEEVTIRHVLTGREGHLPWRERWMTVSFLLGIRHGWRIAETSFPLSRINFENWDVLVHSKGDKWRTVPLHPELRPIFAQLKADDVATSCTFPDNSPQAASRQWSMFFRGCERDNIKGLFPHLCHHCCRVSVISRLARSGVPERVVMEFVGHWSVTSHRIYSRVAHGDLARCILPDGSATALPPSPSPEIAATDAAMHESLTG